ncbi:unnamed protein product, partial [Rotaria magnacalcarata]
MVSVDSSAHKLSSDNFYQYLSTPSPFVLRYFYDQIRALVFIRSRQLFHCPNLVTNGKIHGAAVKNRNKNVGATRSTKFRLDVGTKNVVLTKGYLYMSCGSNSNFHCIVILICTHRTNVEQIFKRATVDAVNSPYDSKTAAEIFYVPASTIRRLRGESSLRSHVGRPSYLSNDEELYFVSLLQLLPKYGQSLGLSYRPGVKWLCLFMNRHANDTKWQREGKTERERAE